MKRLMLIMAMLFISVMARGADGLPVGDVNKWNVSSPLAKTFSLGSFFDDVYSRQIMLPLPGTMGVDKGPASDGVFLGSITKGGVGWYLTDDGGVFASDNVDMNDADANDVAMWPATPEENDAIYFGSSLKFCGVTITVGTAAADLVMTTVAEYWNGSTWATLTLTLDETSLMKPAATGAKNLAFIPPSNWTKKLVGSTAGSTEYWIRFRVTAYTSKTTMPLITRGYVTWFTQGSGIKWPHNSYIKSLQWYCTTTSGTTADSKFLFINLTRGTWFAFTATKGTGIGETTGLNFAVAKNDQVVIKQIQEDASTEFADMTLLIKVRR